LTLNLVSSLHVIKPHLTLYVTYMKENVTHLPPYHHIEIEMCVSYTSLYYYLSVYKL